jgi:hypothetical protein
MYRYHIFLIHSSVVGHLGCFHNLAPIAQFLTSLNNSKAEGTGAGGVAQAVEYLPHKHKALSSISGTALKEKEADGATVQLHSFTKWTQQTVKV